MDSRARHLPIVCGAVTASTAAWRALDAPEIARDVATLRVLGLADAGPWRMLDAALAALLAAVPIGMRSYRAALVSALACGVATWLLCTATRALLARAAFAPRMGLAVAAITSVTAGLGAAWQLESTVIGGGAVAAAVALAPLAILTSERADSACWRAPALALAAGASLSYSPWLALVALAPWLAFALGSARGRRASELPGPRQVLTCLASVLAGALPLALGRVRHLVSLVPAPSSPGAVLALVPPRSPLPFLHDNVGWLGSILLAGGCLLAVVPRRTRPLGAAFVGSGGTALLLVSTAPDLAERPELALVAVAALLGVIALSMQAVVLAVQGAHVPFAAASAAMVVMLELAYPAVALDESGLACDARASAAVSRWANSTLGGLPPLSVLVTREPRLTLRIDAERVAGRGRGDLLVLDTTRASGRLAAHALAHDPVLAPLLRDLALEGHPGEASLALLAASRPLVLVFDATWDRALARHLVPAGLLDRFHPEPRGISDRRRALEALGPQLPALVRGAGAPEITEMLLRGRLLAMTALGERDVTQRAQQDWIAATTR